MKQLYLSLLLLLVFGQLATARTLFVNQQANGNNDGSTWNDAFTYLDDALTAWQSGDSIWVAAGKYSPKEGKTTSTYRLPSGCRLFGSFKGNEKWFSQRNLLNNSTILSGDINTPNYANDNIRTIVTVDKAAYGTEINGFILQDGYNYYVGGGITMGGGAIRVIDSELIIRNCKFYNNYAYMRGGAIYQQSGYKHIQIEDCEFENNSTGNDVNSAGGAIFANSGYLLMHRAVFTYNSSKRGGAIATYEVTNYINWTTFSANTATSDFGGAFCDASNSKFDFDNCLFAGNYAADNCPAIYSSTVFNTNDNSIINCTFSGNKAGGSGTSTVKTNNSTAIYNSIFYGNASSQSFFYLSPTFEADVQNCLIEEGISFGSNNLKGDPLFVSPGDASKAPFSALDFDYRFRKTSPCFNTGNNNFLLNKNYSDLQGNARIQFDIVDMGAYEGSFDLVRLTLFSTPKAAQAFDSISFLPRDTTITLKANNSSCYQLLYWSINDNPTNGKTEQKVKLSTDTKIEAHFIRNQLTISTTVENNEGGITTGDTVFKCNPTISYIISATPDKCYEFVNWTDKGKVVSTNRIYTISVNESHEYAAHFKQITYNINAVAKPDKSGIITGAGSVTCDSSTQLTATSVAHYKFIYWSENEAIISTDSQLVVMGEKDRNLVANFMKTTDVEDLNKYNIQVFPNPASHAISITSSGPLKLSYALIDTRGIVLLSGQLSAVSKSGMVDVSDLPTGFYFLKINANEQVLTTKVQIMR